MTAPDDPDAGLKRALASAISHAKIQRSKGRTGKAVNKIAKQPKKKGKQPKPKRSKRMGSGQLTAAAQKEVNALVSPEAQAHGIYEPVDYRLQEVTEGGKRKEKTLHVIMNRGGTAVERWARGGRLEDRQVAAIAIYERNHRLHYGMPPRVVANWGAVITGMISRAVETCSNMRLDAKQLLRLFDQDIFFRRGVDDFNVWQNVVIHDEPAGVAGSRLGFNHKPAEAIALFIVQSVSHEIATLVVDRQPRDLEGLILNLDTPRKPRT